MAGQDRISAGASADWAARLRASLQQGAHPPVPPSLRPVPVAAPKPEVESQATPVVEPPDAPVVQPQAAPIAEPQAAPAPRPDKAKADEAAAFSLLGGLGATAEPANVRFAAPALDQRPTQNDSPLLGVLGGSFTASIVHPTRQATNTPVPPPSATLAEPSLEIAPVPEGNASAPIEPAPIEPAPVESTPVSPPLATEPVAASAAVLPAAQAESVAPAPAPALGETLITVTPALAAAEPALSAPPPPVPDAPKPASPPPMPEPAKPSKAEPAADATQAATPPPVKKVAQPAATPLDAAAVAAAFLSVNGQPPQSAEVLAASVQGPDWVALSSSLASAAGEWRALFLGAGLLDLPGAAALAARKAGLALRVQVTEAEAGRAGRLRQDLAAKGLEEPDIAVITATVGANAGTLAPSARLAQDLLRQGGTWDLVRIGLRGMLRPLVNLDTPLLSARVRWLMLTPENRVEEATAIRLLLGSGWTLVAERPAQLRPGEPRVTDRLGAQLWRGPLG